MAANQVDSFDPQQVVQLTGAAQDYFAKKLVGKEDKLIRLSTKESGCTGFAYVLDLVDQPENDDAVCQCGAISIAIASTTLPMVTGTEIDIAQEGVNQVVKFNNPNVVSECGCGESFSVTDKGVVN